VPPTHEVLNQPPPLAGYDLFEADPVLAEALDREGAGWAAEQVDRKSTRLNSSHELKSRMPSSA